MGLVSGVEEEGIYWDDRELKVDLDLCKILEISCTICYVYLMQCSYFRKNAFECEECCYFDN